ncbi:MAG TPA: hypothetical protein PL061_10675, partial [Syntrophales bacterium]|nr:hypothetical protein [Syntrophales bacterium]
ISINHFHRLRVPPRHENLYLYTAPELFAHEYDVANSKEPSTCVFIDVVMYNRDPALNRQ